jgi:hypothetical protein
VVLDDWLDEADAAKAIRRSVRTLRTWRRKGIGPPYAYFGRAIRYNQHNLREHYEAAQVIPVRSGKQRMCDPGQRR